ncbi:MAG: PilZ domain-containing protein [Treponema succinifaciens]|uniref:PilZ domain-containing protein n=1 Tax=Treponema succinifaciens TaxID=167 RepID=UPI002A74EBE7|nr:PilZ domain-containing protein [Treponema succinifaciens]MDY2616448.1 PilZ domain-containing protein [Treponema succinifaciens]
MPAVISVIVTLSFIFTLLKLYKASTEKMNFFSKGFDYGFRHSEISALWQLAKKCGIEEPLSLYISENSVNRCISSVIEEARQKGAEDSTQIQAFLEKLYKFKTRVILDKENKRGIESTKSLDIKQKLSVILKGKGVFKSRILNNGTQLIILLPYQISKQSKRPEFLPESEWEGKEISVYFWRKGDAGYAFDTKVIGTGIFRSDKALFLMHSTKLDRTQKRQSIRCKCEIYAQMYIVQQGEKIEYDKAETNPGYKCLLEDISEDGAMIRIGGKGKANVRIKIQFEINGALVVMHGVIRAVEWNSQLGQSRIHFECTHIEKSMRNTVLAFVYNVIPPEQKEIHQAIEQASLEENQTQEENSADKNIQQENSSH